MKQTFTVRLLQGILQYAPYVAALLFALGIVADKTAIVPSTVTFSLIIGWVVAMFVWLILLPAKEYIEILPAKEMIIDRETSKPVFKQKLNESVEMIPEIDLTLARLRYRKLMRVRFEDSGCLQDGQGVMWFCDHVSAFNQKVKTRLRPYKTPGMYLRELKKRLKRDFKSEFSSEPQFTFEPLS